VLGSKGAYRVRKYLTGCGFTQRVAAQDIDGYARLETRGGSIGPLVFWLIRMIEVDPDCETAGAAC
jgi:hypothetical protein